MQAVRRHARGRGLAAQRAGERKRTPQAAARRARPGSRCTQEIHRKKSLTVGEQREAVGFLVTHGVSQRRACALVNLQRSTFRYQARPDRDPALAEQVQNLSALPGVLHHLDLFPPNYANQVRLVDIWLDDVAGLPQHLDWRVIASPGHTPESLCLYNPFTYELLCGDTVITVEGGAPLVRGATDRRRLEDTLRVLRSLEVSYLYPGHGRPILGRRPLSNASVEW